MKTVRLAVSMFVLMHAGALIAGGARAQGSWWNSSWHYRVPVTVPAGSYERYDKPVEVSVNFTSLLTTVGGGGSFDDNTLRVVEVNGGGTVTDTAVAFQFDRAQGYDPSSNASGNLVILLAGVTPAGSARTFHVYFEVAGSGLPEAPVTRQVTLTDDVFFEGQNSFKIETPSGTYYYHKQGGGFAGMRDRDGLEWLGYHPTPGSGSAGEYRGIPNMVFDISGSDFFHPGFTNSSSSIVSTGPLKATFRTKSNEPLDPWECVWDIFPGYARMTLVAKGRTGYWFLYEGTPGGGFDGSSDFVVRADGTRNAASDSWEGDLGNPEWVYFGDGGLKRTLFLAHHNDDAEIDSYRQQEDLMTVFGFGRTLTDLDGKMSAVPATFTVGFAEDSTYSTTSNIIASAFRDIGGSLGAAQMLSIGTPAQLTPANGASQIPSSTWFTWTGVSGASGYHLQVSVDPGFASSLLVDDAAIADTSRQVSGLLNGSTYYWRVRAMQSGVGGAFSPAWSFSTTQALPTLKSPEDGATVSGTSVKLIWTNVTGASSYHLQVSTNSGFTSAFIVNDSTLLDTIKQVSGLVAGTTYYWRVAARLGGPPAFADSRSFTLSLTGIVEEEGIPRQFFLDQNYPNPFNPSTVIRFGVAEAGVVRLEVFTILGEKVATLVDGMIAPGVYAVTFSGDGANVAGSSGLYLYRLSTERNTIVRKMLLLK